MKHTGLSTGVAALLLAAPAWGAAAVAPSPLTGAAEPAGLEDIVVTAQRRSESAQRAAIAIDVVTPAELARVGAITPAALNAVAPALIVTRLGGPNTSYFIRGVGNFTGNAYSDPAIAFNLDGVYVGRPTSTTGTFFDLERVEVLKGPQGTLYGRNATGGAINVIPVKPKLGEFSGYATASYGNYNALDVEAAVNAPIGAVTAIRLSGKRVRNDGYNIDGTDDENSQAVRLQILSEPSSAVSLRLAGDYAHSGGMGSGSSFNGAYHFAPGAPATATSPADHVFVPANLDPRSGMLSSQARAYFATLTIPGAFINPGPVSVPYQDNAYYGIYGEAKVETGVGTLTVIPAYRDSKLNTVFVGPAFRGALIDEHDKQYSLEARFDGKRIGPIDWLVGAFYYDEDITARYTFSQYAIQSYQTFTTGTKSYALFSKINLNLSDSFRLVGGLRYTHDRKALNANVTTLLELCHNAPAPFGPGCYGGPSVPLATSLAALPFPVIPFAPFGTSGNFLVVAPFAANTSIAKGRVTYRLAAEYDVGEHSLLYASYETGYRSGGFSTAIGYESYKPEYLDAATLGLKTRFLDNRAQLNVEVFHWNYRDQQVTHFGVDAQNNLNLFTQNVGRSTIQGVDLDGRFLITPTTLVRGSVQYLDSKVKTFAYTAPRGPTSLPPTTGCSVAPGTQGATLVYTVDCSGKRGSNSPKWSINAGIEQTIDVGNYMFILNGDARYRSNRVTGFDYLPQQNSGNDTTFDASVLFGPHSEKWSITGYVRNIGNKLIPNITQYVDATGSSVTTQYAPPRTFGARASVKF